MRRALIGLVMLVACDEGRPDTAPPGRPTTTTTGEQAVAVTKEEDVTGVEAPRLPDPAALDALVEAAPAEAPPPTGKDGLTSVGTDTGLPGEELAIPASTTAPAVVGGEVQIQPQLSSPAIEREARAQIYWSLRECKGPDGRVPPPESITLAFTLREDGTVDPASVIASADDEALQSTAECVLRAFSATPFEGPVATRRTPARIRITWPSVD